LTLSDVKVNDDVSDEDLKPITDAEKEKEDEKKKEEDGSDDF